MEEEEEVIHQLTSGLSMFIPCFLEFQPSKVVQISSSVSMVYHVDIFWGCIGLRGKLTYPVRKKHGVQVKKKYGGRDIHNGDIWRTRNQQPSKQNGKIWM
jgi:hypothetical protein